MARSPSAEKKERFGYEPGSLEPRWKPGFRLGVGALGAAALALSKRMPRRLRTAARAIGALSVVRALANRDVTELVGWLGNPVLSLDESVVIRVPAPEIFDFLKDFSNYPAFLSGVQSVVMDEAGNLRWSLKLRSGVAIRWKASITRVARDQAIGWRSNSGAIFRNSGYFELTPVGDGSSTRLHSRFSFAPPVGVLGYAAVQWLGIDPRRTVSHDLARLKELIEERHVADPEIRLTG